MKIPDILTARVKALSLGVLLTLCCTGAIAHEIKTINKFAAVYVSEGKVITGTADGRWVKENGGEDKIEVASMVCFVNMGTCTEGIALLHKDGRLRSHFRHYQVKASDGVSKTVYAVSNPPSRFSSPGPYDVWELFIENHGLVKRTKSIVDGDKKTVVEIATLK